VAVQGLDNVLRNLNNEIAKIKGASVRGLLEAAIHIRQDMAHTPPLVPVDYRNLEASWFITSGTVTQGNSPNFKGDDAAAASHDHSKLIGESSAKAKASIHPLVIMGFSASYAAAVHERMTSSSGKAINWSRPGSGPKFFESALTRNRGKILKIIARHAKIK